LVLGFSERSELIVSAPVSVEAGSAPAQGGQPVQPVVQAVPAQGGSAPAMDGSVVVPAGEENLHGHDQGIPKPSPEVVDAIREMKKPSADEGRVISHADGTREVNLGNRFISVPVATVGKDGKVHVDYHGEKYAADPTINFQSQKPKKENEEIKSP